MWSYNKKDVVPILKALKKVIAFHHDKDIILLKLGCTLPNVVNVCLHKSTDAKFNRFMETDKSQLEKNQDFVGGRLNVFARKAVVNESFFQNSTEICSSKVGIDARQHSMCQPTPIGLFTR